MINFKKLILAGVASIAVAGGIWLAQPSEAATCKASIFIVACGTPNHASLKSAYSGDVKAIYNHFGINDSMINGANMHEGVADSSNDTILVNGQVVATNAQTMQRNRNTLASGSLNIGGTTVYTYATHNSMVPAGSKHSVFVWTDQYGRFIAAVDKGCGNVVWGTPTYQYKDIQVCDTTTNKVVTIKENQFNNSKHSKDVNDCKQIKVCDLTTNKVVIIKEKAFDSKKHSKDVNDCNDLKVCDLTTEKVVTIKQHQFDDKKYSKDANDCKKIQVCDTTTDTIVTIKEKEFDDKKYSKDLTDCDKIEVCDLTTGETTIIKEKEFDDKKHSKDLTDCNDIKVCRISDKTIVTIKLHELSDSYSEDLSQCDEEEAPTTTSVVELPHTGIGEVTASVLGLGGVTAAGSAYLASRRRM